MRALVVGGTGPTGPFIVNGLYERGYRVAIFHRGVHETGDIPVDVEHIHGDPHFPETISAALGERTFDLVVVTYGRTRHLAQHMVGRAGRFIGIGGVVAYRGYLDPARLSPSGLPVPTPESFPLVRSEHESALAAKVVHTEDTVLALHPSATYFRYPYVYGPNGVQSREWSIIRRVLDQRPHIVVPEAGLQLESHGYAENLAHAVMLAVEQPERSAGQIYNVADEHQLTLRQIIELICRVMDYELAIVTVPMALASGLTGMTVNETPHHRVVDIFKIRSELGYTDLFTPEQGLERTVRWYLSNRPERNGALERSLGDPFDYGQEDALVAAFGDCIERLRTPYCRVLDGSPVHRPHPYAHPKRPGEADPRAR